MTVKSRRQQLEEMLAEDPNDAFLRYGLAMDYVSAGDDATAARHFHDLVQADAAYVAGYMQGGQALARLGRTDEARALWQRGVAQARAQGNAHAAEEMTGMIDGLD